MLASLYWRAFHITIGTIHAAVTLFGPQQRATALTIVVELARIGWHQILRLMTTFRACQC